ncbi:MAG: hypothetical protein E6Q67_14245 [Roseateles sp.]|nr:MAG: hypothetical protein E6Q67_14245 [Roseateles sp.]
MHYQISEDEFHRIAGVGHQIALMFDLVLAIVNKPFIEIGTENLSTFLGAQKDELEAVLKTVDERYDAQRVLDETTGALNWIDWTNALEIARGYETPRNPNAAATITRKLSAAASIDPDWRCALSAWTESLAGQNGERATSPSTSSGSPARRSKREKMLSKFDRHAAITAVAQCIETGSQLLAMKGACKHGEFMKRLEAIGMSASNAQRHMLAAARLAPYEKALCTLDSPSKVFALLPLDDDALRALVEQGKLGDLKLSDIAAMSVSKLREAVRKVVADASADASL